MSRRDFGRRIEKEQDTRPRPNAPVFSFGFARDFLYTKNRVRNVMSMNDYEMIQAVGFGVAMENAEPLVKEKADFITKSNDEDGVLYVINQFMRD